MKFLGSAPLKRLSLILLHDLSLLLKILPINGLPIMKSSNHHQPQSRSRTEDQLAKVTRARLRFIIAAATARLPFSICPTIPSIYILKANSRMNNFFSSLPNLFSNSSFIFALSLITPSAPIPTQTRSFGVSRVINPSCPQRRELSSHKCIVLFFSQPHILLYAFHSFLAFRRTTDCFVASTTVPY